MSKKAVTMLVLSCVFVTITAFLLFLDSYVSISSYMLLFGSNPESFGEALGAALGGVLLFVYTILLGIAILVTGGLTLPFVITLLKVNGKKWYAIVILVFAIIAMVAAIVYIGMLPTISKIQEATQSSSSSNPESVEALLML